MLMIFSFATSTFNLWQEFVHFCLNSYIPANYLIHFLLRAIRRMKCTPENWNERCKFKHISSLIKLYQGFSTFFYSSYSNWYLCSFFSRTQTVKKKKEKMMVSSQQLDMYHLVCAHCNKTMPYNIICIIYLSFVNSSRFRLFVAAVATAIFGVDFGSFLFFRSFSCTIFSVSLELRARLFKTSK